MNKNAKRAKTGNSRKNKKCEKITNKENKDGNIINLIKKPNSKTQTKLKKEDSFNIDEKRTVLTVKQENFSNIQSTPVVVFRKNYQEETEKNQKRSSKKILEVVEKTPSIQKNNEAEKKTLENSDQFKERENYIDLFKITSGKFRSRSVSMTKFKERRLEEIFFKKPKKKYCFSDYYAVNLDNIQEEFLHPLIPNICMNDDRYKTKVIREYIRNPLLSNFNTDSVVANRKRTFSQMSSQSNSSSHKLSNNLNNLPQKRRKVSSVKKIYESTLTFVDENKKPHYFKIYEDRTVGFDFRYDQILKEMEFDNDVATDDEQLYLAKKYTLDSLRQAMENFSFKSLRNKMRFKRSRSCDYTSRH
jgi:hypothetical protein